MSAILNHRLGSNLHDTANCPPVPSAAFGLVDPYITDDSDAGLESIELDGEDVTTTQPELPAVAFERALAVGGAQWCQICNRSPLDNRPRPNVEMSDLLVCLDNSAFRMPENVVVDSRINVSPDQALTRVRDNMQRGYEPLPVHLAILWNADGLDDLEVTGNEHSAVTGPDPAIASLVALNAAIQSGNVTVDNVGRSWVYIPAAYDDSGIVLRWVNEKRERRAAKKDAAKTRGADLQHFANAAQATFGQRCIERFEADAANPAKKAVMAAAAKRERELTAAQRCVDHDVTLLDHDVTLQLDNCKLHVLNCLVLGIAPHTRVVDMLLDAKVQLHQIQADEDNLRHPRRGQVTKRQRQPGHLGRGETAGADGDGNGSGESAARKRAMKAARSRHPKLSLGFIDGEIWVLGVTGRSGFQALTSYEAAQAKAQAAAEQAKAAKKGKKGSDKS